MSHPLEDFRSRREYLAQRSLRIALALSVLVHLAALWKMPLQVPSTEQAKTRSGPLIVQLSPPVGGAPARPRRPPPRAQRPPRPEAPPRATERLRPPLAAQRPRPPASAERPRPAPPPVIARQQPAPGIAVAPKAAPPTTAQRSPNVGDLASYVEAMRGARGAASPPSAPAQASPTAPAEDENARANRIAAANLGLDRKPTFGPDPRNRGGVFDITHMGYDRAEFLFYGWNKDIRRNTTQTIEVRKGGNSDMRIAVVQRMIAIIRDNEQGDFVWESKRLGRNVTLSARLRDNSGLEEFLMREFFEDPRGALR